MLLRNPSIGRSSRVRTHLPALAVMSAAAVLLCFTAQAGVKITTETRQVANAPDSEQARAGTIWLDGSKLRMEASDQSAFIFRGDKQMLWALDAGQKSYVQLDEQTIGVMGERVTAAQRELDEHIKNLPDKEREMMQKMVESFAPGVERTTASTAKTVLKQSVASETIDGKPAKKVDLIRAGERVGEVWFTDWQSAGSSSRISPRSESSRPFSAS